MILLNELIKKDPRFPLDAYWLINDGLQYTYRLTGKKEHITAHELLEGIRQLMLKRYGQMAKTVLNSWRIYTTDDIGQVVFNLVNAGLMVKRENETLQDFHAVYEFEEAFVEEYSINRYPGGQANTETDTPPDH